MDEIRFNQVSESQIDYEVQEPFEHRVAGKLRKNYVTGKWQAEVPPYLMYGPSTLRQLADKLDELNGADLNQSNKELNS